LFEEARRRLVETSPHNRLIHVNRSGTHGPILNVINERSDDVYATLCYRLHGVPSAHCLEVARPHSNEMDVYLDDGFRVWKCEMQIFQDLCRDRVQ
jgi:hypothetical protein